LSRRERVQDVSGLIGPTPKSTTTTTTTTTREKAKGKRHNMQGDGKEVRPAVAAL